MDGLPKAPRDGGGRASYVRLASGRGKRLAASLLNDVIFTGDLHQVNLRIVPVLTLGLRGGREREDNQYHKLLP